MNYIEKKQTSSPRIPIIREESGNVLSVTATARGRKRVRWERGEGKKRQKGKEKINTLTVPTSCGSTVKPCSPLLRPTFREAANEAQPNSALASLILQCSQ